MSCTYVKFLNAGLGIALTAATCSAQFPGQVGGINQANNPAFSPYLNLNRPGINPVINYYGTVRPQLGYNTAIGQLQVQQSAEGAAIQQQQQYNASNILPPTGHAAGFQTQGRYFLTRGAAGVGGGPGAGAAAAPTKGAVR
jgi:hypothetical protein